MCYEFPLNAYQYQVDLCDVTLMSILMHLYVDHLVYFLLVEVHREILQVEGDAHVTVTSGEGGGGGGGGGRAKLRTYYQGGSKNISEQFKFYKTSRGIVTVKNPAYRRHQFS